MPDEVAPDDARSVVGSSRIDALDGLRGVAALVVVFHHTLLVVPALAQPYREVTRVPVGSRVWWAAYTPLHLLWGGGEAVYIFFVLSGFVLARPYLSRAEVSWTPYFAKRLVRLYGPVLGALVMAGAVRAMVKRDAFDGGSWWLIARNVPITFKGVLNDALLVFDPGTLTGVLWSLRWEVFFSLLLPLFVAIAQMSVRTSAWVVLGMLSLVMLASQLIGLPANLFFLPLFGFGVLLASREPYLRRLVAARRIAALVWWLVSAVSLLLLSARWMLLWLVADQSAGTRARVGHVGDLAVCLGSALLVVSAMLAPPLRGLLTTRPARWLGSRSFSLYLVHEPIVVSAAYLAGGWRPASAAAGVVVALVAAELLYRVVERPSIALAKRAERAAAARLPAAATP